MRRLLFLFLLWPGLSRAQDTIWARRIIDTLASPAMEGRGYVRHGDRKAAAYLRDEFIRLGLAPLGDSYYQRFRYPVNTFPKRVSVSIDGKALVPGKDFLVAPHSAGKKGRFDILPIGGANFRGSLKTLKKKFLLLDKSDAGVEERAAMNLWITDPHGAAGVIEPVDKLTWSVARNRFRHVVLQVLRTAVPDSARTVTVRINECFRRKYRTQNVVGYLRGTAEPDSFIVFTAHYDHLGRMGRDTYFPGANDNASGVSMLLNLAAHYAEYRPRHSMLFIAFGGEEAGLMGSEYFVKHPPVPLSGMKFLLNMDLLGTGDDGLMVVNGAVYEDLFARMYAINEERHYVKELKKRPKARNSDHYWFSENDVPSFFIYTLGGVSYYHDINDRAETLPLTDYADVFRLVRDFIDELDE